MSAEIVDLNSRRPEHQQLDQFKRMLMRCRPAGVIRKNERVAFRGADWQAMNDLAFKARHMIGQLEEAMSQLAMRGDLARER